MLSDKNSATLVIYKFKERGRLPMTKASKNIRPRFLLFQYCLLQGGYWASFCAIYAFSTVLLLAKGFTSSQIGITVALGNILGVIFQPVFAGIADSAKRISIHSLTAVMTSLTAISFGLLYLFPKPALAVFTCFLATNTFLQVTQPLVNSVSIYYINHGISVDFGVARAVGSISYAAASSALGWLIEKKGANVIIPAALLFLALMLLALLSMPALSSAEASVPSEQRAKPETVREPFFHFFFRYRRFTLALLGVTLLFTFHNMTNSYLIQIVESLGGDSADMGAALSFAAVCELPVMLLFTKLKKRFSSSRLFVLSGFFFAAKAGAYLLAQTVPQFLIAQIFQMGAFALYIPASVYYVNETMAPRDKFKGQAVMTATNTLGGVIGSLLGGFLLDHSGVSPLLISGFTLSAAGAILLFFACRTKRQ